ncbi:GtrA family protein [Nakamurella silvestris]|nr:GtrA family protein [Nakamurella silvestris]
MTLVDRIREYLPERYRQFAKFLIVGGVTWVIDAGLYTLLSHTVLAEKPLTAKIISVLVSMIVNYVLNREWSFAQRGGREKHHEAMLFFLFNGIGLGINLAPLAISRYVFNFNPQFHTPTFVSVADFIAANLVGTALAMGFRYWAYSKYVFLELPATESGTTPPPRETAR